MRKILQLSGLDCAACAAELERKICEIDGVESASLSFVSQRLVLDYDTETALENTINTIENFEEVRVVNSNEKTKKAGEDNRNDGGRYALNENSRKKEWTRIGVAVGLFLIGVLFSFCNGIAWDILKYAFFVVAYLTVGLPILINTGKNIAKGKIFDENFLMTVASLGAFALGEASEAVMVMILYQIGEALQEIAVGASRRSLAELMDLKSEYAILLKDGKQEKVDPKTLQVGDILLVRSGEKAPVDGILLGDAATLDTKSLTGESELRTVKKGEDILSGTVNCGDAYPLKAIRRYEDSAVEKILTLVENASSEKAKPEKFITKFAKYYTPIVCVLALVVAFVAPFLDGLLTTQTFYFKDFSRWAHSALTFLVVSCPCALIISVPLTYFSGIGACAKKGVLVKGATYLDVIAKSDLIAWDKTGTLTEGNFVVCNVEAEIGVDKEKMLALASALEKYSAHPIAKAFEGIETDIEIENVKEIPGRGLKGDWLGKKIVLGNETLMRENRVEITQTESMYTTLYFAVDGHLQGKIEVGDRLRREAKETLQTLRSMGIERMLMLTGDQDRRAHKVANEVGITEVRSGLLPDEKLLEIRGLKKENDVLYVGDGINDAPVMAVADCAVSMGKLGSAAAVEASDFVLIGDNLKALPKTIRTARKTKMIVMENIVFSISLKIAFMILSLCNVLPLALAVFADVGVMLLAVLNSFRVKGGKQ